MAALKETPDEGKASGERIAKVIARSGLCSRRDAEILIGEKRVSVNGAVIESAALDVLPADKILVDGKALAPREPPRLWRYHKPKGRVTTHKDPEGRPAVFDALPENLPRLISVGRLDFNTEGLLLLTNDGDLARHLELPSTAWARRYRVRAFGQIEQSKLDELAAGLRTGGVNYGPIEAKLEREQGDNVWITLSIREGKNREVRRIMEHLGLTVNRLIRVSFGPFMLGDLEAGQIEEVKTSVLKDQLGPRLARQLGVKREPLREERPLAPGRAKPTYLRRKPAAPVRPSRPEEEPGPLKRRRILPMDGAEAPKVEYVREKRPRPDKFGRSKGGPERPHGRDQEGATERNERERPASREGERRWSKTPDGEDRKSLPRREERTEREYRKRPSTRDGERAWSKAPDREDRKSPATSEGGERRWKKRPEREDGAHPGREGPKRWSKGGDRTPDATRKRAGPEKGRDQRASGAPFARKKGEGEGERPAWRERPQEGAERPRWKARSGQGEERPRSQFRQRGEDKDKPRTSRPDREPRERRGFEGDGARTQGPRRQPANHRKDETRGDSERPKSFEKRGFKGSKRPPSGTSKSAKPFKRREGAAARPRPSGPKKPRPQPDKETP